MASRIYSCTHFDIETHFSMKLFIETHSKRRWVTILECICIIITEILIVESTTTSKNFQIPLIYVFGITSMEFQVAWNGSIVRSLIKKFIELIINQNMRDNITGSLMTGSEMTGKSHGHTNTYSFDPNRLKSDQKRLQI